MNPAPDRRTALGLLAALFLCHLLLARPLPVPHAVRAMAALWAVILLPGISLVCLWPGLPRSFTARLGLSFPAGLVLTLVPAAAAAFLHWPIRAMGAAYLFGGFLLALAVLHRSVPGAVSQGIHRGLAGAMALAVGLAMWGGAPSSPYTDAPDHVATVREILLTGDAFPDRALVADGEVGRSDPRKGTLHFALAVSAAMAGLDAHELWRWVPAALAPVFLAALFLLARRLGAGEWGSVLAAVLGLVFLGGDGLPWALRIAYGAHAAMLAVWLVWWLQLGLLSRSEPSGGGGSRAWFAGLLLAGATAVHPLAPGLWLTLFPGLLVLSSRSERAAGFRILGIALVPTLPVLALRVAQAWGPINPLHAQPMPELVIAGSLAILWPPAVLAMLGGIGVLGAALALGARAYLPPGLAARFLVAAAGGPLILTLVPGVFDLAREASSSLPIKTLYLVPGPLALALFLTTASSRRRLLARVAVGILIAAAAPGALGGFHPDRGRGGRTSGDEAVLSRLRDLPGRVVVAADPWLSYLIAAETPHYALAVPGQHGHPLDTRGLERLNHLAEVLSPRVDPVRAAEILGSYRCGFVAVPRPPGPRESGFAAARGGRFDSDRWARFSAWSSWTTRLTPPGGVWRVTAVPEAPDPVPGSPPGIRGWIPESGDGAAQGVRLRALDFPASMEAGRVVAVTLSWEGGDGVTGWPVEAHIRIRPAGWSGRSKIPRLAGERLRGRVRTSHRWVISPFKSAWPPGSWPLGTHAETISLHVPSGLPEGDYEVSVRVLERPVHTRLGWRDIWFEDDRWQGQVLGVVHVAPSP